MQPRTQAADATGAVDPQVVASRAPSSSEHDQVLNLVVHDVNHASAKVVSRLVCSTF